MKRSKKNKILLCLFFISCFVLVVLSSILFIKIFQKRKIEVLLENDLTAEVSSTVMVQSFLKEVKNGTIESQDEKLDTSTIGEKDITILLRDKRGNIEKYSFRVSVIDTTKPTITAQDNINVYVGTDLDLLKVVQVEDNSQEDIVPYIKGEYDLQTVGKYSLQYVAIDSSFNEATFDFTVNVIEKPYNETNYTFTTSNGFLGEVKNGETYIDGILIVNKTFSIPSTYGNGLTSDTQDAFDKMAADASSLGLNLYISSGYRSYNTQVSTYNYFVNRDGQAAADTYSARAGHSEHQTGLAFDLNSISDDFTSTPEGKWVQDNCYRYGLILRYPKGKDDITGYKHESWHLRYVGEELANKLYNNGDWITLEEYFGIDSKYQESNV